MIRNYLIAVIISVMLAIENAYADRMENRRPVPIVYNLEDSPGYYPRKRALKRHFQPVLTLK